MNEHHFSIIPEEMMESQIRLLNAQQQVYQANKGLFDRLWAESLQNDPLAIKRAQLQLGAASLD